MLKNHLRFLKVFGLEILNQLMNENYLTHYEFAKRMNKFNVCLFLLLQQDQNNEKK